LLSLAVHPQGLRPGSIRRRDSPFYFSSLLYLDKVIDRRIRLSTEILPLFLQVVPVLQ
jgi:hypothetical protein